MNLLWTGSSSLRVSFPGSHSTGSANIDERMYLHRYTRAQKYASPVYVCKYDYTYVCMYANLYVSKYICLYLGMQVCVYACARTHPCVYTYLRFIT